jgi:VanZ family protein
MSFSLFLLQPSGLNIPHLDKFFHFVSYAIFAVLGYRVVKSNQGFLYICIGIVIFSGLIEIAQSFTPDRQMSAADLVANIFGVLLGSFWVKRMAVKRQTA